MASALRGRWSPKGSEHLPRLVGDAASKPLGKETTRWENISSTASPPLLQSGCLWLGSRDGTDLLPPTMQSKPLHPSSPAFHLGPFSLPHLSPKTAAILKLQWWEGELCFRQHSQPLSFRQRPKLNQKLCQLSDPACFLDVGCGWFCFRNVPMTKSQGLAHSAPLIPRGIPGFAEVLLILSLHSFIFIDLPH